MPSDYLVKPISRCFKSKPGCNRHELVVLLSSDTAYRPLPIDTESFEQVLEEQKAIAILAQSVYLDHVHVGHLPHVRTPLPHCHDGKAAG